MYIKFLIFSSILFVNNNIKPLMEQVVDDHGCGDPVFINLLPDGQVEIAVGLFTALGQHRRSDYIGVELHAGRSAEGEVVDHSDGITQVGGILAPLIPAREFITEEASVEAHLPPACGLDPGGDL